MTEAYTARNPALPGGDYSADQNPDGTWNVRHVPVYPVHQRKLQVGYETGKDGKLVERQRVFDVTEEWLRKAVEHHQYKRDAERFLYPLHASHHAYCGGSPGQVVKGVGFIMPVSIEPHLLDGKTVPTLFFDFIAVKPEMFALMERNELTYASAEILNTETTVVYSVSLMEHDVPYFRFPLITIGVKTPYSAGEPAAVPSEFSDRMAVAVAYSVKGGTGMPKPDEPKPGVPVANQIPPADKPEGKPETKPAPEGGGGDKIDQIQATLGKIVELLEVLVGEEEGQGQEPIPPKQGEGAPQVPASMGGEKMADEETIKRIAAAEAKADLAAGKADKLEHAAMLKTRIAAWRKELMAYNLGDGIEEKLLAKAQEGEAIAQAYVDAIKAYGQQMPPSGGIANAAGLPTGQYPKEVMAYAADGPDALAAAQAAFDSYAEAVEHRISSGMSCEEWIKWQMRILKEGR